MNALQAVITEIFSSVQGEGLDVGERQIFIRFEGCNLHCRYCDESNKAPGSSMTVDEVCEKALALHREVPHPTVCVTGGEPLLRVDFLAALLPKLRAHGWRVHLETNAVLPDALAIVGAHVDLLAADIKLPSVTGEPPYWKEHKAFLRCAVAMEIERFVKVVVSDAMSAEDFHRAIELLKEVDPECPLILQPQSRPDGALEIDASALLRLQSLALHALKRVWIRPQMHKVLNLP